MKKNLYFNLFFCWISIFLNSNAQALSPLQNRDLFQDQYVRFLLGNSTNARPILTAIAATSDDLWTSLEDYILRFDPRIDFDDVYRFTSSLGLRDETGSVDRVTPGDLLIMMAAVANIPVEDWRVFSDHLRQVSFAYFDPNDRLRITYALSRTPITRRDLAVTRTLALNLRGMDGMQLARTINAVQRVSESEWASFEAQVRTVLGLLTDESPGFEMYYRSLAIDRLSSIDNAEERATRLREVVAFIETRQTGRRSHLGSRILEILSAMQ